MNRTLVLDVVGLTPALLAHAPNLSALAKRGGMRPLDTVVPAVTTTVQSTFVTGALPREHGIVGNGWYFRDLSEIWLWRQSNRLVGGEKLWEAARSRRPVVHLRQAVLVVQHVFDRGLRGHAAADVSGRRPQASRYPHSPGRAARRTAGHARASFRCSASGARRRTSTSTRWIGKSALHVLGKYKPTLTLVYLPHLDYNLQRLGPNHPDIARDVAQVDEVCGELIDAAQSAGAHVVALSEYGITEVSRPVHINRALRQAGWLRVRDELGRDQLDAGASEAFAVADHQIAHVYVARPELVDKVANVLRALPGVERVLDEAGKREMGLDHPRSGELVAIARPDSWFTYYHFLDDARAPDYARTVDIHRKPGYDPVELFIDPALPLAKLRIAMRLAQKMIGMRYLMDVISLDATLVKGSHGRPTDRADEGPLFISSAPELLGEGPVAATEVKRLLLDHIFASRVASARRAA